MKTTTEILFISMLFSAAVPSVLLPSEECLSSKDHKEMLSILKKFGALQLHTEDGIQECVVTENKLMFGEKEIALTKSGYNVLIRLLEKNNLKNRGKTEELSNITLMFHSRNQTGDSAQSSTNESDPE